MGTIFIPTMLSWLVRIKEEKDNDAIVALEPSRCFKKYEKEIEDFSRSLKRSTLLQVVLES